GFFFFASRRRHTRLVSDWSSDVCSSDLDLPAVHALQDGFAVRPLADWQAGTPSQARAFDPDCDPQAPPNAEHYAAQVNAALRDKIGRASCRGKGGDAGGGPALKKTQQNG